MKWVLIILFVALSFIPSLMARKRTAVAADDAQDAYDGGSDSDSQEDDFFNFGETEAEEVAPDPEPYFTYEAPQTKVDPVVEVATVASQEEHATPAFDLRSAIVYQTVLTNKYITGEN